MGKISKNKLFKNIGNFVSKSPITADIFLNNFCNNNCVYCTFKRWDELVKNPYSMAFEDFVQYVLIMLQLGVKGFILTGGGEPTICKDFDKITSWLESNKLHYGINTNFNVLKYIKPDYLKVSLDGCSRDTYRSIRGVDAFDSVIANICSYADWKKTNSPETSLGVQCVVQDLNEVQGFYHDVAKDLPVDYIVMRPIESTGGSYYKDKGNEERRLSCLKAIKEIAEKDSRVVVNYKWHETSNVFGACLANWSQIAINEHGDVIYCCHKPYEVVCHITDPDVLRKKAEYITNVSKCDVPCRLTGPNEIVRDMSRNVRESMFI